MWTIVPPARGSTAQRQSHAIPPGRQAGVRNSVLWGMALALRGLALFLGVFTLIGLIGELRGRTTDLSLWWVDLRDLPGVLRIGLLTALSGLLVAWAVRAAPGLRLRRATALACAGFALLAVRDSARFVAASGSGLVHSTLPVPFSLFVAATLAVLAVATLRAPLTGNGRRLRTGLAIATAIAAWGVAFPLAQMFFFGTTDYRRPADAAVIFGARVYASGNPSPLLADRIRTGVELYRSGLIPTLVMSGGDGADGFNEAQVMRDEAIAGGVSPTAIVIDPAGLTTEATVANAMALVAARPGAALPPRIIAVSQAYHLPRIQLSFATAGIDVLTVPAADPQPIGEMPWLVAREVPAFWVYYLRVCLG
jgi:vancomycin permeability regulator SanA